MADYRASIPEKVKKLVASSLSNQTGINGLADPNEKNPLLRSEFFQLRNSCSRNETDDIAKAVKFTAEEIGQMCDEVLFVAADRMRNKQVDITDPTHLLAPILYGQTRRGYGDKDGSDQRVAILGAQLTAVLNNRRVSDAGGRDLSASDEIIPVNFAAGQVFIRNYPRATIEKYLANATIDTNSPNLVVDQNIANRIAAEVGTKLTVNTAKGIARDSAFTYATAVWITNNGNLRAPESQGYINGDLLQKMQSTQCTSAGANVTRSQCTKNGYSLSNNYILGR